MAEVAARYPDLETHELEAELAVTLLHLKRRPPPGVRDWEAYLTKALLNRASSLARKWRAQRRRETHLDWRFPAPTYPPEEVGPGPSESRLGWPEIRRCLDAEDYRFLRQVRASNWNQSRLAILRGEHRNTIRRRLDKIRRKLLGRPIEIVSGRPPHISKQGRQARLRLTPDERYRLCQVTAASGSSARDALRARLILALAAGETYAQIARSLHTSAPTISRWKRRFAKHGIKGLKAKHQGRKPRMDARGRLAEWLRAIRQSREDNGRLSYRQIARRLGISKSTVHRILVSHRTSKR